MSRIKKTSLLMQLGYSVFARVRARIVEDCDGICAYCGVEVVIGMYGGPRLGTIDHKVPLSRGGTWKRYNLTCACRQCNGEKANMTAEEFMDYRRGMAMSRPETLHADAGPVD
jgi:5-methylcytosine-specific restriction endonuclease McrA